MDGTVRVWNLLNGQCQHTLTGHTSLVGLLGLSPSFLVSAAADSTLRIWDPDTGELKHTLAAHTGAITCFQHDEFKVLSGSDGNLKMWNIRDGTVVRDLLTGITGVWQVVFEGRWCVAASNRNDTTVLDVWDFATEKDDDDWIGEPPSGMYDDDIFSEDEDEDDLEEEDEDDPMHRGMRVLHEEEEDEDPDGQEQADVDAMMDQDLVGSETDSIVEIEPDNATRGGGRGGMSRKQPRNPGNAMRVGGDVDVEIQDIQAVEGMVEEGDDGIGVEGEGVGASRWAPLSTSPKPITTDIVGTTFVIRDGPSYHQGPSKATSSSSSARYQHGYQARLHKSSGAGGGTSMQAGLSSSSAVAGAVSGSGMGRTLPTNEETPTRPRMRPRKL